MSWVRKRSVCVDCKQKQLVLVLRPIPVIFRQLFTQLLAFALWYEITNRIEVGVMEEACEEIDTNVDFLYRAMRKYGFHTSVKGGVYTAGKVFRIGTECYNWPMSAHASQAFSIAHCTDSEDLPAAGTGRGFLATGKPSPPFS